MPFSFMDISGHAVGPWYSTTKGEVLPAFSKCRQKDMEVLCDLSISAYHAINFSKLQYAQCLARKQAQDKVSFIPLCATL
ncbi:hypothetical protein TNIN_346131 [Trichonephila inaurata madagascariensis]|uniref:Uncharacterized protein n=1 Tax=Trichonephila inaurata madagascariensis TaxID=2747483 RepID=A0A8X6Y3S1_9ARAC|nr:hypothetical protein TNIN_346131 [Trichonephila inaurata madagascariensis]